MRVLEPVEKQVKYTNKPFIKLHQNPYFILMCSNTIYILNNTLIECFDIASNETNKLRKEKQTQLFVFDFTKEKCTATSPKMARWKGNYV